jgi:hypothetical protein
LVFRGPASQVLRFLEEALGLIEPIIRSDRDLRKLDHFVERLPDHLAVDKQWDFSDFLAVGRLGLTRRSGGRRF